MASSKNSFFIFEIQKLKSAIRKLDKQEGIAPEIISEIIASSALNLEKGGYVGTAEDLRVLANTVNTGFTGISVTPTSAPTGTGVASWIATQNGTYTNFGGVVVSANSLAVISRSALGVFSISQTSLDINKNIPWANQVFTTTNNVVTSLGKDWYNNAATLSTDIPGTSSKWVERLNYLGKDAVVSTPLKNLFDKNSILNGFYIHAGNGSLAVDGTSAVSDYIAVEPSTLYTVSGRSGNAGFAFYTANKTLLPPSAANYDSGGMNASYTTTATTYFIRMTVKFVGNETLNTTQFEKGTATSYQAYKNLVRTINGNELFVASSETNGGLTEVSDLKSVMVMGSSLTDSFYQPKGASWIERVNDVIDLNIVNNAVTSTNQSVNMVRVVNNTAIKHDTGSTPLLLSPAYILWNNSANGTTADSNGMMLLANAKDITESLGAKMLLGSEEDFSNIAKQLESGYKAFAKENDVLYSPMIELWRKSNPLGAPYTGFNTAGHSGYRTSAPYSIHTEMLCTLYIEKNIKMFKVRPTYKAGSPLITDLVFDDNFERLKFFTAVSSGATDTTITSAIDNLDNSAFNLANGVNVGVSLSETSIMIRKGAVSFSKFALIEFILERIKIKKGTFTVASNVAPTKVYIAKTLNTGTTFSNTPRTTYDELTFTYSSGQIVGSFSDTTVKYQMYDKVRIVIEYNGVFTLTNPVFYSYDGVLKSTRHKQYNYRKFGTELMPFTDVETGWTLGGTAVVKSFPAQIANYTSYNTKLSHLQLQSDTATASKTITIPLGYNKVAVRIVAQNFAKIQTTRFIGTAIENSEYIEGVNVLCKNYDYDYGILSIKVQDYIKRKALVYQGWHEIYLEIDVNPSDTSLKIELLRESLIDASYSNHLNPILIHNVSIQKIE